MANLAERARMTSTTARTLEQAPSRHFDGEAMLIPLDQLRPYAGNARTHFDEDEIAAMAASIRTDGLLQPITVREIRFQRASKKIYEVMAGERRFKACQIAGLSPVPCRVRNVDDVTARRINLIENLQRVDLNDAEKGKGIETLRQEMQQQLDEWRARALPGVEGKLTPMQIDTMLEAYTDAPRWMHEVLENAREKGRAPKVTWEIIGAQLGLRKSRIHQLVQVAGLPDDIQDKIAAGDLSGRQARAVAQLGDERQQRKLAREIEARGLTGEAATARAREISSTAKPRQTPLPADDRLITPHDRRVWLGDMDRMISRVAQMREVSGELPGGFRHEIREKIRLLEKNLED